MSTEQPVDRARKLSQEVREGLDSVCSRAMRQVIDDEDAEDASAFRWAVLQGVLVPRLIEALSMYVALAVTEDQTADTLNDNVWTEIGKQIHRGITDHVENAYLEPARKRLEFRGMGR